MCRGSSRPGLGAGGGLPKEADCVSAWGRQVAVAFQGEGRPEEALTFGKHGSRQQVWDPHTGPAKPKGDFKRRPPRFRVKLTGHNTVQGHAASRAGVRPSDSEDGEHLTGSRAKSQRPTSASGSRFPGGFTGTLPPQPCDPHVPRPRGGRHLLSLGSNYPLLSECQQVPSAPGNRKGQKEPPHCPAL